jgi:hypothetical protein
VAVNSAGEVRQLSLFIRLLMGFCYRPEGLSIGLETQVECGFREMRLRRANKRAGAGLAFVHTFVNIEEFLKQTASVDRGTKYPVPCSVALSSRG